MDRDYSTISPSAKSILLMKGCTSIPYARETAELISYPGSFTPDFENKDFMYWARVMHFEARYLAINQLCEGMEIKNYLELSSGFSFRCLEKAEENNVIYIDTDLKDIIEKKKEMIGQLNTKKRIGNVILRELNALDETQFKQIVSLLPPGEIAIINEGLMIYLNSEEKDKLCKIIKSVLEERGGCWITSDIYIRAKVQGVEKRQEEKLSAFREQHNIEENKFSSFEEAKIFVTRNGFTIEKEESIDVTKISSYQHFASIFNIKESNNIPKSEKMNTTWKLVVNKKV